MSKIKLGWFKIGVINFNLDAIKKESKTSFKKIHAQKEKEGKFNSEHYWNLITSEIERLESKNKNKKASA